MDDERNPLQAGAEPIASIDAAKGILFEKRDETPAQAAEDAPRTPDPAPEAEAAAETPSGDEETTETEAEDLPPIDPPSFWKKAARDLFATLPRDAQQAIVERERERERGLNTAMQEAAEKRKAAEAERTAAETERQTYTQQLTAFIPALQRQLQGKWATVDWTKLARESPAEWAALRQEYDNDVATYNRAIAEHRTLAEKQQVEATKAQSDYIAKAEERLIDAFPEWRDQERGRKEIGEIRSYLAKEYGVPTEHLGAMVEPYHFQVARKAMLYDRAQKAKAEAVTKPVPKVQTPGSAKTKADRAAEERAAKLQRLEKTGSLEDARGLLRI